MKSTMLRLYGLKISVPSVQKEECTLSVGNSPLICGDRRFRVEHHSSLSEYKGGEFFYCPQCDIHLHADVDTARTTVKVIQMPKAASGRKSVSTYNER